MKSGLSKEKSRRLQADKLFEAILALNSKEESRAFFSDLCTPAELEAMADRWRVVGLLVQDKAYRTISASTGVSLVTIGRVARALNGEKKGYRRMLEKLAVLND